MHCARCSEPLRGLLGSNTLLVGRYRVTRVLGCGGMGAVYLAEDTRIGGRQVAIKENLDPAAHAQFQAEVAVMSRLSHPGLPAISDQFVGPNGRQYLVMDFIAGDTLEERVNRGGPLPEAEVVALARDLMDILAYLHANGVIHRDIKPANIKLTPAGKPVLVDFGIAKQWAQGTRTQSWARGFGSPGFASPEHYGGRTDERSDLYSLGAVLYFLVTAQVPPEAPRLAAGGTLTPPRQIRPALSMGLQRVIFKAMAPLIAQRYGSAGEMRRDLLAVTTPTVVVPGPAVTTARRGILAVAGASAAAVIVLIVAFVTGVFAPRPTPPVVVWITATHTAVVSAVPAGGRITDTAAPRRSDTPSPHTPATPPSTPTASAVPTPSHTPLPTLTPTRIPPTSTPTSTRISPTNTPRPTVTFTREPPKPIASNVSDFSDDQGGSGWWYQIELGRNSGVFEDFPSFGWYGTPTRNCWQTNREAHVRICEQGEVHPGVTGRIAYRWRSDVGRSVRVEVHAHKIDTRCGDGVWIGVYRVPQGQPPGKIGEFAIGGRDGRGQTNNYSMTLNPGDSVLVMVDIRGESTCDATQLAINVF